MPTKAMLRMQSEELLERLEAAADVLTDPDLADDRARAEALEELGYRVPEFLLDSEESGEWEE